MKKKVLIVGAGMMGSGIAAIAALHGCEVVLVSSSIDSARRGAGKAADCLDELLAHGLTQQEVADQAKDKISIAGSLEEAVAGVSLCIEAIYEKLADKQELFERLDALLPPEVPILSNTSGLQITQIVAKVARYPERTMTAHFWLPGHLVPLVEIVMWEKTDEAMALAVRDELAAWGKAPVIVRKDLPGQLANRILQAIIREAVNIVSLGLASAEDVDTAIKMGMGIRFPAWGPLEHIDAVGLDLCANVQDSVLPGLSLAVDNPTLRSLVDQGNLGYKTGQGMYDWSQKDMDALLRKRNHFIINALKILKEEQV